MSSISPFSTSNILPPTIPQTGPSLSSESEDEGDKNNPLSTDDHSINPINDQVVGQSGKFSFICGISFEVNPK